MASIFLTRSRTPLLKTSRSLKNEFRKGNNFFFIYLDTEYSVWFVVSSDLKFGGLVVFENNELSNMRRIEHIDTGEQYSVSLT